MSFIGKALGLVLGGIGAVVGFFLGGPAGAAYGFSIGASIGQAAQMLAMETTVPDYSSATSTRLNVSIDPDEPRKIAFGKTALGTDEVYWETFGPENSFFHRVIVAAGHTINSYGDLYFDDEKVTFSGDTATGAYAGALTKQDRRGFPNGTALTVGAGTKWTSAATLTGLSHYALKYVWSQENYPRGFPSRITREGEGALVYDPRRDSTQPGGSGTHRADNQTTWEYAPLDSNGQPIGRNPALQILWYEIGWRVQNPVTGEWIVTCGRGRPLDDIDFESFIVAANDCEEEGYYSDVLLSTGDAHETNIAVLEGACAGRVMDTGGLIGLRIRTDTTGDIVQTFSDNDVLDSDAATWRPSLPLSERWNQGRGSFVDPRALYQIVPLPIVRDATYEAEDGFKRAGPEFRFDAVQDPEQAQKLIRLEMNISRYQGVFTAPFGWRAKKVRIWDCVTLSFSRLGFDERVFRVLEKKTDPMGAIWLLLREDDASVYSAGTVLPVPPPAAGAGYDPRVVSAPDAGDWTIAPIYREGGGAKIPIIAIAGGPEATNIIATHVWWREYPSGDWVFQGAFRTGEPIKLELETLSPGEQYSIGLAYENAYGVISARTELGPYTMGDEFKVTRAGSADSATDGSALRAELDATEQAYQDLVDTYGETAAAAASATAAASSAAQAAASEDAAQLAETNAETAQSLSEAAKADAEAAQAAAETAFAGSTAAQTASETARDSAQLAETNAETAQGLSEAAQAASEAARNQSQAAQTASEAAQSIAEAAKVAAQNAETSASASAVSASASAGAAQSSAIRLMPSKISDRTLVTAANTFDPEAAASYGTEGTDVALGDYVAFVDTANVLMGHKGTVPHNPDAVYEVTFRWLTLLDDPTTGYVDYRVGLYSWDGAGLAADDNLQSGYLQTRVSDGVSSRTFLIAGSNRAGDGAFTISAAAATFRPHFRQNPGNTPQTAGRIAIAEILIEDVTARVDAEAEAAASAVSASASSASATAASQSASAAQTDRLAAQTARSGAESAETSAVAAKNDAEGASAAAQTSATNAANSATSAGNSASAASTSASSAATSATNAGNSATAANSAKVAAESARDNAQGSATAAASSASTAATEATDAAQSASAAQTAETTAETAASNASASETAAATSETNAAGSAASAGTSASNAATSASQAGGSATAAANSASTAQTAATNAGNSATAAETSKVAAEAIQNDLEASDKYFEIYRITSETVDEWVLTAPATEAVTVEADALKFTNSGTGVTQGENAAINTGKAHFELPPDIERASWGSTIKLIFDVEAPASGAATNFAVAYSSNEIGNSAWQVHPVPASRSTVELVQTWGADTTVEGDFIGVVGDASGAGGSVLVHSIKVQKLGAYQDGPAAASVAAAASSERASVATAKATEAGQSASAAQTSETNAATSAGQASTSAGQAATSAGQASTSASQASSSASDAAGSASQAAISQGAAADSETAAGNSASAASTSASTAQTAATNAGASASSAASSATNAANSATSAGNSASAASTSASNAASSATAAGNSASAADSSRVSAEAAFDSAQSAAIRLMPSKIEDRDLVTAASTFDPDTAASYGTEGTDVALGDYVAFVDTANAIMGHKGTVPHNPDAVYEVTFRFAALQDDPTAGNVSNRVGFYSWDGTGTVQNNNTQIINPQYLSVSSGVTSRKMLVAGSNRSGDGDLTLLAGAATWRPHLRQNITGAGRLAVGEILIEDVTARVDAEAEAAAAAGSASAAAGSASSAASSATAAGNSASAAQTSETNASTSAGQASTSAGQASTSASQASTSATNAAGSASAAASSATAAANSATSAGNSASAASTSASTAQTAATNAGNSASAADTAKVAAESAFDATQSAAIRLMPSKIEDRTLVTNARFFDPDTVASYGTEGTDTALGNYVAFEDTTNQVLGHKGTVPHNPDAVYEVSYRFLTLQNDGTSGDVESLMGLDSWDGAGTLQDDNLQVYPVITSTVAQGVRTETLLIAGSNRAGDGDLTLSASAATLRPRFRQNAGGATAGRIAIGEIDIRDVTARIDAEEEAAAAAGSASAAASSASSASTSAGNAATSATSALNSATSASTSATNAAGSATAAGNSASSASTSAGQASTSASNAAGSASSAATSATAAANSQSAAAGSASAASTSASNAATSATDAETAASASQSSATSASTSAGQASTSATQASNSAANAAAAASTATTQASNAAGSATAASTSAAAASDSAGQAAAILTQVNARTYDGGNQIGTYDFSDGRGTWNGGTTVAPNFGRPWTHVLRITGTESAYDGPTTARPCTEGDIINFKGELDLSQSGGETVRIGIHFTDGAGNNLPSGGFVTRDVNSTSAAFTFDFDYEAPQGSRFWRAYIIGPIGGFTGGNRADLAIPWAARVANGAEVKTISGAVSDIEGAAAYHVTEVAAIGSDPAIVSLKAGKTGSAIGLAAKIIRLINNVGGTTIEVMRAVGGYVFFSNPISIDRGGKRLTLGSNDDFVLWCGPDTIDPPNQTLANSDFTFGVNGLRKGTDEIVGSSENKDPLRISLSSGSLDADRADAGSLSVSPVFAGSGGTGPYTFTHTPLPSVFSQSGPAVSYDDLIGSGIGISANSASNNVLSRWTVLVTMTDSAGDSVTTPFGGTFTWGTPA